MSNRAYFNNAATTFPKPVEVYDAMDHYYRNYGGSVGRGNTEIDSIQETRELLKRMFHCPSKHIVFVSSATEAINIILRGISIQDNYNIYISPFEHNAVTRVLHYMGGNYKLNIYQLSVDEKELRYDLDQIKTQFIENPPNLVVVSHASNVCGIVAPIHEICQMSKKYNAINIVDMCQTAGLIDIDISSEIYDFNIFAGHKTLYGPYGVSGFVCSGKIKLEPLIYGGTGVDSANPSVPDTYPERFEVGSQNTLAITGLNAALTWILSKGVKEIYKKEQESRNKLLKLLEQYDNIKVFARDCEQDSIGVISCVFDGYSSDNIGEVLMQQGVEVRTGLHCSPAAHKFLKTFPSGTVRFSLSYFSNEEDFSNLKEALDYIYENS